MRAPLSWLRSTSRSTPPLTRSRTGCDLVARGRALHRCRRRRHRRKSRSFLVGRVLEAAPHPNADRLRVCQVDVGEGDARQIVCGAWNFEAGATVAVALLERISRSWTSRSTNAPAGSSVGMILAEDEVGLGEDHAGIAVLEHGLEPGTPLADVLPIRDHVLDVTPTVNRVDLLLDGRSRAGGRGVAGRRAPPSGTGRSGDRRPRIRRGRHRGLPRMPRYIGRVFRTSRSARRPRFVRASPPTCDRSRTSWTPRTTSCTCGGARHASITRSLRVGESSRPPCPARRGAPHARRQLRRLVPRRSHDHRRRAFGRARRDHGRRGRARSRRARTSCCSKRRTSSTLDPPARPSDSGSGRRFQPLGEGRRPVPRGRTRRSSRAG